MQIKKHLFFTVTIQLITISILFSQVDCSLTTTDKIPINDLGTGFFMGYQGGLYPGGTNVIPLLHKQAGNNIGKSIKPLNEDGVVDFENGQVVFAAFGASTAGNTFNTFKATVQAVPGIYNPCLKFVNLCMGGKGLETMVPPGNKYYWDYIADSLTADGGVTAKQVQIAWIKTASKDDSVPEFPLQADSVYSKYIRSIMRMKDTFPNLKLLYISSHAYGGYSSEFSDNADLAGEPAAYYGGFAVKWVVGAQISGDPNLVFSGPATEAPWINWGPYFWADGITPRVSDGLTWICSDFDPEGGGFHLSEEGKQKEADMMIDNFYAGTSSRKWFRAGPAWAACDPFLRSSNSPTSYEDSDYFDDELTIYPSPNNGNFYISFYNVSENPGKIIILNNQGQEIYEKEINEAVGDVSINVDLKENASGIYHVLFEGEAVRIQKTIVVN